MPSVTHLRSRLTALAATLVPPADSTRPFSRLDDLLLRSHLGDVDADTLTRELSIQRATWYAPDQLPKAARDRLDRLFDRVDAARAPEYRVFRRETPVRSAVIDLATPAWGRGAAVEHSLGPFQSLDGRQFWFDFFPIVRLVPVYLPGDPAPALLMFVRELRLRPGDPIPIREVIRLLASTQYDLAAGSFWIRANLLAAAAPAGTYVGLRISGGRVRFTRPPIESNGKVTLPPGGRCAIDLSLVQPAVTPNATSQAGADAREAKLALPKTCALALEGTKVTVTAVADSNWTVYGQPSDFRWTQQQAAFEPEVRSVGIPLKASISELQTKDTSPFTTLTERAPVDRAAWLLPLSVIDVEHPTEAAGIGSLGVKTKAGLTIGWNGLRKGPVALPSPWVTLAPGTLAVIDFEASNLQAHQRLRLWKDADSKYRSTIDVRFTGAFPVVYVADASGSELLFTVANSEARLDRPVDVKGGPLPVRSLNSLFVLSHTDQHRFVALYDDNILIDSLDPDARWPVEPGQAVSLAIRNALFTVTPVNSVFLFAELQTEEMVKSGVLLVAMGLYGLLPTLPDPYAARLFRFGRLNRSSQHMRLATQLLVASVLWKKAATDAQSDDVTTSFAFAPLGTQEKAIEAWSSEADPSEIVPPPPGPVQPGDSRWPVEMWSEQEQIWGRHFGAFNAETFALVDVSTNADQMGVSFAWFNPRVLNQDHFVFYEVFRPKDQAQAIAPFPVEIRDLDLSAQSRFVRAFTTPLISWEPVLNWSPAVKAGDPPAGPNFYPNDGGPTRLFNDSVELVPIAPIPVTEFLVEDFHDWKTGFTGALFTLPFGLRAFAEFRRTNKFQPGTLDGAKLSFNRPEYESGALRGGIQLRADAPPFPGESPIFQGSTLQLDNVLGPGGMPTGAGTLGSSVGIVFNDEFFYGAQQGFKDRGVPLTRIDFSGYGASIFSHWFNPNAAIAATSQTRFDVFVGRTAHEIVQIRSLVYPWGIRVVRTITLLRTSSAYVHRFDSGWQAESDGIYDFRYNVYFPNPGDVFPEPNPYTFHPGIVKGVFKVRNIRETNAVPDFTPAWNKANGEPYIDENGVKKFVNAGTPIDERNPPVLLRPVFFDCDVQIDGVTSGAVNGRVPSKGMLGYVQLKPRGELITPALHAALINSQFGSIGGPVDCVINIANSKQLMRIGRVDVNNAVDGANNPIFVGAARGSVVLPRDGSWSVVQHTHGSGEVAPLDANAAVPVIRRGQLNANATATDATAADVFRLADPADLVKAPVANTRHYGLLQSTDTQKALFRKPRFKLNTSELLAEAPDFADAYRLINSKSLFPNVQDALPLNLGAFKTLILNEGYQLRDQGDPTKVFEQVLPEGPLYLINEEFLKIYVEYSKNDKQGAKLGNGSLRFGFDSAGGPGKSWLSKVNDIGMVVDLGSLKRLLIIRGRFDAEKGASPAFIQPELDFSDALKPVIDILEILMKLQGGDYQAAFQKGLEIAMSNSADSWNYAFHARKEIPVVKFPPGPAYDSPGNPLKLEAHLAVGVYFNEVMPMSSDPGSLVPSAGAFLEFGGRLSVMCASVGIATIYATGAVDLRTSADIKTGPALHMKFGFGAEIVVGLPVVANVSLLFMVGIEIDATTGSLTVAGFLLFRGRAEILGGIVTVTITIEAKGIVKQISASSPHRTDLIAQVTFGLDISIFLVINISFSESWSESRQIS
jgi:hypothetical protein